MDPSVAQTQQLAFQKASDFLKNGDPQLAEQLCRRAIVQFPDDANFLCLSARALMMMRRFVDADERLSTAITRFPRFGRPWIVRGEMHLMQGKPDDAIDCFEKAEELGDDDPNLALKLSRARMMAGDEDAARAAVDELLEKDPVRAELVKAFELEKTGNEAAAEKIYRNVLKRDPHNVEALRLLAGMAVSQRQYRDAEVLLKRALDIAPDFGRAIADLVQTLTEQEKIDEALEQARKFVRIAPDNPDAHLFLGNASAAAGRHDDAIKAYRRSLRIAPTHPGALSGLAHNLKTVGRQDEAIEVYRSCIKANPYFTETYWSLANLKTFRFTDDEVNRMNELLASPNVPENAQVHLHNALGLECEGREDYDGAFEHFKRCNEVRRGQEYYDPVENEWLHDWIVEVMTEEFVSRPLPAAEHEATPIFVVGLPRSGSTLIEQILASHSRVVGTHELSDVGRVISRIPKFTDSKARYPHSLKDLAPESYGDLGRMYLERTAKYHRGAEFFVDKNPNNFVHVGFLHLILPQAVIIDARRHPLDSCLGSFKQLFARGQAFSYDLADIGDYYLQYLRIMDHWNAVLPGKVLRVDYEDVVGDLETQLRRMLDHCGLAFEEQCLRFHETDRPVKTASSEQVRRPIYSSSVNLWRRYEKHLQPLIEILEPVLRELPPSQRPDTLP